MATKRKPNPNTTTLYIDARVKKLFQSLCAKRGVSMSGAIVTLLKREIQAKGARYNIYLSADLKEGK